MKFGNKLEFVGLVVNGLMPRLKRLQVVTVLAITLGVMALLAMGAVWQRQNFLTRGIPKELPLPANAAGPTLGINVYLDPYDEVELAANLAAIRDANINYVKQPFYYTQDFDWKAADRLITAVANHNLTLIPLLDGDRTTDFTPPENPSEFADWAAVFAARYGEKIDTYIIWDEPNLSSHWGNQPVNANEYAALLTSTAAAIRAVDNDALIVAAPLAPTIETGPENLAEHLYLQQLYEAGAADAFDIVSGKPYGFDVDPLDRTIANETLNFSRIIRLREVLEQNGEAHKAVWGGNWGWNSLPIDWQGGPSLWGQTTPVQQAEFSAAALERARREWPWMGLLFLENWEPDVPADDPRWGFSVAGTDTAVALQDYQDKIDPRIAYPGFHFANPDDPAQSYKGGWRFSPEFGADISETAPGAAPDEVSFTFWGTDVGLRVRRANFRARLYVTVDGKPANALPHDENGAMLILTSPDPNEDYITTVPIAENLEPGVHDVHITAARGWDQWALQGFSVGYFPPTQKFVLSMILLALFALAAFVVALSAARQANWGSWGQAVGISYGRLSDHVQLGLTAVAAAIAALTGWLTWGQQLAGAYRRMGDGGQLALTAAAASIFYITPSFFIYVTALLLLFVLITLRPAWGLALIAFCFPFYVSSILKPIFIYRFSPVEIFTLITLAAYLLARLTLYVSQKTHPSVKLKRADWAVLLFTAVATLSLFFTERLDVATNEWRLVILEPALFYLLLRAINPRENEMWIILDAFVFGGVVIALIGLGQYIFGQNLIAAEDGLLRLRSIYGSPNNVALYLGRITPLLAAMALLDRQPNPRRRKAYAFALLPTGLAILLTFSKGGLFLGVPAGLLVVFWIWQRRNGRSPWPWIIAAGVLGSFVFMLTQQLPLLAGRFNLTSATGIFRLNLWRASLEMIRENPLFGVGLDNFLYAYRGRYILDAAWQEPNLNHPHNIVLDFATRLGILGLISGAWMLWELLRTLKRALNHVPKSWFPVAVGFSGSLAAMLAHGLVDHSFFLVDLAFGFYLLLGTAVWLDNLPNAPKISTHSFE